MNWSSLWESVKEPLRLLLLGLIAWGLTELAQIKDQESWMIVLTFILRFVDKWVHELGKETDNSLMVGGITRF